MAVRLAAEAETGNALYGRFGICHHPKMLLLAIAALAAAGQAFPSAAAAPPPPPPPPVSYPQGPRPKGNLGTWVTANDYPAISLRNREEGAVAVRLEIDRSGRVSNCAVTVSSGFQALDDQTCILMTQRAVFNPARDSGGNPVEGTWSNRIRWSIPDESSVPFALRPYLIELELIAAPDGTIKACRVVASRDPLPSASEPACPSSVQRGKLEPSAGTKDRRVRIRHETEISDVE